MRMPSYCNVSQGEASSLYRALQRELSEKWTVTNLISTILIRELIKLVRLQLVRLQLVVLITDGGNGGGASIKVLFTHTYMFGVTGELMQQRKVRSTVEACKNVFSFGTAYSILKTCRKSI